MAPITSGTDELEENCTIVSTSMMKLWPGSRKTMSRVEDVAVAGGRRHVVDVGHSFKLVLMVENDLQDLFLVLCSSRDRGGRDQPSSSLYLKDYSAISKMKYSSMFVSKVSFSQNAF